jgi:outer membrane lipoprotein-sorting protein|tara:strand:- start:76 stop:369 length:294 start_codon:yes stop_codon:yes gene_type:complete
MKIIFAIFILSFLNGCVQSTAFFGPAVTVASTGSVYQAGLSYASSKAIIKITGKTPAENVKIFLKNNENDDSGNANNFFEMVKKINTNSSVKTLANQ